MAKKVPGKLEHARLLLEKIKSGDLDLKELGLTQEIIQELEALVKEVITGKDEIEKIKIQLEKKKEAVKEKEKSIGRVIKDIKKCMQKDISKKVLKELGLAGK